MDNYEYENLVVTTIGEPLWSTDGVIDYGSIAMDLFSDYGTPGPDGVNAISTLEIVEEAGNHLISRHVLFGHRAP